MKHHQIVVPTISRVWSTIADFANRSISLKMSKNGKVLSLRDFHFLQFGEPAASKTAL
jgi:hypothetical protein